MQKAIVTDVDQLLQSLRDGCLVGNERSAALKLLIAQEDQFGRDMERLELAFDRAGHGRAQLRKIKLLRDRIDPNSDARRRTEELLATMEETQRLLEASYEKLLSRQRRSSFNARLPETRARRAGAALGRAHFYSSPTSIDRA